MKYKIGGLKKLSLFLKISVPQFFLYLVGKAFEDPTGTKIDNNSLVDEVDEATLLEITPGDTANNQDEDVNYDDDDADDEDNLEFEQDDNLKSTEEESTVRKDPEGF